MTSLLSTIRSLAQTRSHAPMRKFTDQALIQCVIDGLTITETARKLTAGKSTVRYHADRLNLVFERKSHRLPFSKEDDELIRACTRGEVMLSYVVRTLHCSFGSVRLRADSLGVTIPIKRQLRKKDPKVYAGRDYDLGRPISVGNDQLLRKLRYEYGKPRDEVYPGSVKKIA